MSMRWSEEELREWEERRALSGAARHLPIKGKAKKAAGTSFDPARGRATFPTGGRPGNQEPSEDEEQIALFEWAARMTGRWPELEWLYHVPNGGSRGPAEAGRFRAMGVRRGVPDVALDVARGGYHGLRIEMKRASGGKTSPGQDRWIEHLRAEGYRAEVCHGWTAAARVIEEYLRGGEKMKKIL